MGKKDKPVDKKLRICQFHSNSPNGLVNDHLKGEIIMARWCRSFNSTRVPKEYFLDYDNYQAFMLRVYYKLNPEFDKYYFLNLPKEVRMTKYNWFLCDHCYKRYTKSNIKRCYDEADYDSIYNPTGLSRYFDFDRGEYVWNEWVQI